MMATAISKAVGEKGEGVEPQEIADKIESAMREGGQDFATAVENAAQSAGLQGFTGGAAGKRTMAMTGVMPWTRLKDPKVEGEGEVGTRYFDQAAMRSLQMRAETAKMAEDMMANMNKVSSSQQEFIKTLSALAGASDTANEGLRQLIPEDLKSLPSGAGALESFAGTMLDPAQAAAAEVLLPQRGGGQRSFRLPSQGGGLAQRGGFGNALGATSPDQMTRQYDKLIQKARQINVAEGRTTPELGGLDTESEAFKDAAYTTKRAIADQVSAIEEMGVTTKEGAAAAAKFVQDFMPLIESLKLTEEISYFKLGKTGDPTTTKPIVSGKKGESAADYVQAVKSGAAKFHRMKDILGGRASTESADQRTGQRYRNVPTGGEIFKNAELLQNVMDKLGVTLRKDENAVEALYAELDKLEEALLGTVATMGIATLGGGKAESDLKRPLAQQIGAGRATAHRELTAVQFRTNIDKELETLSAHFGHLGESTMEAVGRMKAVQGETAFIPRDTIYLNKQDWDNLVKQTMRERKIGRGEAESRLRRPGLQQRYPITGGASFLAARAEIDPTGRVEPGKIGVAGPAAVSSQEDLGKVMSSLHKRRATLESDLTTSGGAGESAKALRDELSALIPVITKLNQLYLSAGLNLDFDGDKISFLADTATKAGSGLETFTQKIEKGAMSFQELMIQTIGKVTSGSAEDAKAYGDLISKTRKIGPRAGILAPETGEMAQAESAAHVGGKKSVGLLTDMFNKMELAVLSGSGQLGDAFATWMDMIMLNINKSLAQKSGGGGVAGPMEFIEDLQSGQLNKMFKAMEGGKGIYGELGAMNKEMRAGMKQSFTDIFHTGDPEALRGVARAEGIEDKLPKDLSYSNFESAIDAMVDSLDLKAVITRMFSMMQKNMVRALRQQGLDDEEIKASMADMLKPGKGGKIGGLDLNKMLSALEPEYLATRKKQVGKFKESEPMDRAAQALELIGRHIATEAEGMIDEFSIGDEVDGRVLARELVNRVKNFYEESKSQFTPVLQQGDFGALTRGKYTPEQVSRIGGLHKPGAEGGPGEIYLSFQNKIEPLLKSTDYTSVLQSLAMLQTPVDNFFDKVMVMAEDEKLRENRVGMLQDLRDLFLQVADISLL